MTVDLMHLLTTTEAARALEVSSEAVRQMYHSGKLKVAAQTKLGPLFDERVVLRLKRSRDQRATA